MRSLGLHLNQYSFGTYDGPAATPSRWTRLPDPESYATSSYDSELRCTKTYGSLFHTAAAKKLASAPPFTKGEVVEANFGDEGVYYAGRISRVLRDGTFDIWCDHVHRRGSRLSCTLRDDMY